MRIAVAGTCGLALLIAREINDETSHQLVILSRTVSCRLAHIFWIFDSPIVAPVCPDLSGISMSCRGLQRPVLPAACTDGC